MEYLDSPGVHVKSEPKDGFPSKSELARVKDQPNENAEVQVQNAKAKPVNQIFNQSIVADVLNKFGAKFYRATDSTRHEVVYEIANYLQLQGKDPSDAEIVAKMKTLKATYLKKRKLLMNGEITQVNWIYWDYLHKILSSCKDEPPTRHVIGQKRKAEEVQPVLPEAICIEPDMNSMGLGGEDQNNKRRRFVIDSLANTQANASQSFSGMTRDQNVNRNIFENENFVNVASQAYQDLAEAAYLNSIENDEVFHHMPKNQPNLMQVGKENAQPIPNFDVVMSLVNQVAQIQVQQKNVYELNLKLSTILVKALLSLLVSSALRK